MKPSLTRRVVAEFVGTLAINRRVTHSVSDESSYFGLWEVIRINPRVAQRAPAVISVFIGDNECNRVDYLSAMIKVGSPQIHPHSWCAAPNKGAHKTAKGPVNSSHGLTCARLSTSITTSLLARSTRVLGSFNPIERKEPRSAYRVRCRLIADERSRSSSWADPDHGE